MRPPGEFVGVVLEVSPYLAVPSTSSTFAKVVESLLVWCRAQMLCQRGGSLRVVAALPCSTEVVYSSADCPNFAEGGPRMAAALRRLSAGDGGGGAAPGGRRRAAAVATPAALSRLLCAANKQAPGTPCRALVVKLGADVAAQYNEAMNCVFAASRRGVVLDALVLAPKASHSMQQVARLTGGAFLHVHPQQVDQLATFLVNVFLASHATRQHLALPPLLEADLRAACFCCTPAKYVDVGFVCTSCLAIYCDAGRKCPCTAFFADEEADAARRRAEGAGEEPAAASAGGPR